MILGCVWTGQGSQKVGMGRDFYDHPAGRAVYEEVNDALQYDLAQLAFAGDEETLRLTHHAQPAIMMVSMAGYRIMEAMLGKSLTPHFFAGHSLGEYSALIASGALSLSDGARLLKIRGEAMQAAVPEGEGGMAAIIGLTHDDVAQLCHEQDDAHGVITIANDNSAQQVVVSGHKEAVEALCHGAKERGAKRAIMLEVSAPFHCPLMKDAQSVMADALDQVTWQTPSAPIMTNVTANYETEPSQLKQLLVQQVTAMVRWREMMARMAEDSVSLMLELGPANVLGNLARRSGHDINTHSITDMASLEEALPLLA